MYSNPIGNKHPDGLHAHVYLMRDISRTVSNYHKMYMEISYYRKRAKPTNTILIYNVHRQVVSTLMHV